MGGVGRVGTGAKGGGAFGRQATGLTKMEGKKKARNMREMLTGRRGESEDRIPATLLF